MTALLVVCAMALLLLGALVVDLLRQHGVVLQKLHQVDPDSLPE